MSARHATNWGLARRVAPVVVAALTAKFAVHLLGGDTIELDRSTWAPGGTAMLGGDDDSADGQLS